MKGYSEEFRGSIQKNEPGIYRYEKDFGQGFKSWATGIPGETFGFILKEWGKICKNKDKEEMKDYILNECPGLV